jgi:hypothetical protein
VITVFRLIFIFKIELINEKSIDDFCK